MNGWISVKDKLPGDPCPRLVAIREPRTGYRYVTRAVWISRFSCEDNGDYCAAKGTNYRPEGWYEGNYYEDANWKIDEAECTVTHWMELPKLPEQEKR